MSVASSRQVISTLHPLYSDIECRFITLASLRPYCISMKPLFFISNLTRKERTQFGGTSILLLKRNAKNSMKPCLSDFARKMVNERRWGKRLSENYEYSRSCFFNSKSG